MGLAVFLLTWSPPCVIVEPGIVKTSVCTGIEAAEKNYNVIFLVIRHRMESAGARHRTRNWDKRPTPGRAKVIEHKFPCIPEKKPFAAIVATKEN
jgi:hypothetical protein